MICVESILRVKDLEFRYRIDQPKILKGINLEIHEGEFVGVVGPTGGGKTTLCLTFNGSIPRIIKGILKGTVFINGFNIHKHSIKEISSFLGMVFQDPNYQLFCIDVESELAFGPENLGLSRDEIKHRIEESAKVVGISGLMSRFPGELSAGEKQRVAIASVLSMSPKVLVLDEPTSNLDPIGSFKIFRIVRALKKRKSTIIMISHRLGFLAEFADRIIVIKDGHLTFDGKPVDIIQKEFDDPEQFINPPQICQIFHELKRRGYSFSKCPTKFKEALAILRKYLSGKSLRPANYAKIYNESYNDLQPIIKVRKLSHIFNNDIIALNNVDLDIYPGEFLAIIGKNGSGKTTLAKHLNGLLRPSSGVVFIKGRNISDMPLHEIAKEVGFIFQNPDNQIFESTVRKEIEFGLKNLGLDDDLIRQRVDRILKDLGIYDLAERHPMALSTGQRHRVAVASILVMDPEIIILDEPIAGQDYRGRREIINIIKKLNESGRTVILISHDMELVGEYAKRVIVMNQGKIMLDGSPSDVFVHEKLLSKFGIAPPPVTRLALRLGKFNFPPHITQVSEFCNIFEKMVPKEDL